MHPLEPICILLQSLVAGVYHFQDFERDPEFKTKPRSWVYKQHSIQLYCATHAIASVMFYFYVLPDIEAQFHASSYVQEAIRSSPEVSKSLLSLTFYLALARGRFYTSFKNDSPTYWGTKQLFELFRIRILRPIALNNKLKEETEAVQECAELLVGDFESRCFAIRSVYSRLTAEIGGRSNRLKEHLDGKWAQLEGEFGGPDRQKEFLSHGLWLLASYTDGARDLKARLRVALKLGDESDAA